MSSKVIVLLAPGFEEIEAVAIIDILRRAEIDVTIAGLEKNMVEGSHQISIKSDAYFKSIEINEYDFLILPGGQPGTNNLKSNQIIIEWLKKFSNENKMIGAICAAPIILKEANIIQGIRLTSYPAEKKQFDEKLYSEEKVVLDKNIITSRGVGTAIDFSLELVELIKGRKTRDELAQKILWKT
jgi:4-methyl-5(b-hydroxyethyl)-thiazole monophosphate biosynthesis